jgi:hypothetical protein
MGFYPDGTGYGPDRYYPGRAEAEKHWNDIRDATSAGKRIPELHPPLTLAQQAEKQIARLMREINEWRAIVDCEKMRNETMAEITNDGSHTPAVDDGVVVTREMRDAGAAAVDAMFEYVDHPLGVDPWILAERVYLAMEACNPARNETMAEITNTHPLTVDGLAELAANIPDTGWYEITFRFRKTPDGAEIIPPKTVTKFTYSSLFSPPNIKRTI